MKQNAVHTLPASTGAIERAVTTVLATGILLLVAALPSAALAADCQDPSGDSKVPAESAPEESTTFSFTDPAQQFLPSAERSNDESAGHGAGTTSGDCDQGATTMTPADSDSPTRQRMGVEQAAEADHEDN